jgi:hypothetical protein
MLSNTDLAGELEALAKQARDLAGSVKSNGDLPARMLAGALVEAGKIGERLAKLHKQLHGGNGRQRT